MTSCACCTWFFSRIEKIERPRPISAPPDTDVGPCAERLELQAGAVVVEQDAAVEVADDHRLRQFRHQRGEPVLLFLDRGLGRGDLLADVIQQDVALLRQIVGGARQMLDFRRAFRRYPEIAVGPKHQAQLFGHAEQPVDILLEQVSQHHHADNEAGHSHHDAGRQVGKEQVDHLGVLILAHAQPDQEQGDHEWPGHQQTKHHHCQQESVLCVHGDHPDRISGCYGRQPQQIRQ